MITDEEKQRLFYRGLNRIETQYYPFFENRPPQIVAEKHDKLYHHVGAVPTETSHAILWHDDSIPNNIKEDVRQLFDQIFTKI